MKKFLTTLVFAICFSSYLSAAGVVGFWNSIDDKTGKPQSIVGVYEYQGKYYGRLIATYGPDGKIEDTIENPKKHAPGLEGDPFYVGTDIMWDLKPEGQKFTGGKILDPEKGKIYNCQMWEKNGNLMVRGEIWIFGQTQEWTPATDSDFPPGFKKPDLTKMVPSIPQVKRKHGDSDRKWNKRT